MGHVISADGVDVRVRRSNGGTEVFVEVLMLAVSALARREWDVRFAARIALMDQSAMGRGATGGTTWGTNRRSKRVVCGRSAR
ncbi:hypothetical protein [Jiangella endophytica]|uniref:hypothetical protein n=1 Tax=Jiangella endophytica TaxID=1623398 RepID=UPI000E3460ED|nr:hypothetical protein [Jiangella endophytica]